MEQKEGNFLAKIVEMHAIKWKYSYFEFIIVYQNDHTFKSFLNPL